MSENDFSTSPNRLGDPKGQARERWTRRGTFSELSEAVAIANTSLPGPRYVALGPKGGYSVFRIHETPWGDVESEDIALWPLDETVVFLPPDYLSEPAEEAVRENKSGPGSKRPARE